MPIIAPSCIQPGGDGISRGRSRLLVTASLTLMLLACSREDDSANRQGNQSTPAPTSQPAAAAQQADPNVQGQIAAKRRTLLADAVSALQETESALALLANGKSDDALAALARATGKLDIVLAADPDLALAPVEVGVTVHDIIASPDAVKALRNRAEEALDDGRLQDARHLIRDLASEHVVSVTNIPLATYPTAIKEAAALIHAGKAVEATAALEAALSTLVVEETIIPLPLARAEVLVEKARPLAENARRTAEDNRRLHDFLAQAQQQIELARALGYATKDDLKALSDELATIKQKTAGQSAGSGLLDRIKSLFAQANRAANTSPPAS